ncbi:MULTISPECIES: hypothetical protein [Aliivibrio]|uniref:hypothetical protein n=1 Tax=Aliivibrio TaxID=511678 RepID=UPI0013EA2F61|nr:MULTISPECIES: hypothetical protein [Aliivibrio]MDD9180634.1 hypothetical protein [Aliivibrio sp. A6]
MKVGWLSFSLLPFGVRFIRFGIELILPQIQAFQKLIYASIVLWLCLILACISVFLSAFSIPIVVWIFGLSVPNWLKPNRANGVRKRDCFVSQLLAVIGYFARLIEPV